MKAKDVFTLIQYIVDSGLKPGTSILTDIDPDSEITLQQGINIIDAAVKMQKRHQENMASVDSLRADNDEILGQQMENEGYVPADTGT